eukprot:SAG31_NODE_59_length_29571_cov_20.443506_13_plen_120_part_00
MVSNSSGAAGFAIRDANSPMISNSSAVAGFAIRDGAGLFDEAMSSFFRNVDLRYEDPLEIPVRCPEFKQRDAKSPMISDISGVPVLDIRDDAGRRRHRAHPFAEGPGGDCRHGGRCGAA